jgi:hypothetical protein
LRKKCDELQSELEAERMEYEAYRETSIVEAEHLRAELEKLKRQWAEDDRDITALEDENNRLRAELDNAMKPYLWRNEPPEQEGEFFYSGKTPDGKETIVAIVHVVMNEELHALTAFLLIPPYWRGDKNRACAKLHFGTLDEWEGQWAGPEFGLCSIEHANRAR